MHLALDPEFAMKHGQACPGRRIGTMDAAGHQLRERAARRARGPQYQLPPKVLVVHRFTRDMLTNDLQIRLDPRVQVVIDMDGWGARGSSSDSYKRFIVPEPVQYTGFKLFYKNDTKADDDARQVLALWPAAALHPVPVSNEVDGSPGGPTSAPGECCVRGLRGDTRRGDGPYGGSGR